MNLNQTTELPGAQLECPVETGDMPTANRLPHPKGVADYQDLTSEVCPAGRCSDWPDGSWRKTQKRESGLRVGRHPVDGVPPAREVARHDHGQALDPRRNLCARRLVDANRKYLTALVDHDTCGDPPRPGRRVRGGVLQSHDGLAHFGYGSRHPPLQPLKRREKGRIVGLVGFKSVREWSYCAVRRPARAPAIFASLRLKNS